MQDDPNFLLDSKTQAAFHAWLLFFFLSIVNINLSFSTEIQHIQARSLIHCEHSNCFIVYFSQDYPHFLPFPRKKKKKKTSNVRPLYCICEYFLTTLSWNLHIHCFPFQHLEQFFNGISSKEKNHYHS